MDEGEFAAALGVSAGQVRRYEKGADRVCAHRLQVMANLLQVHFSFFFEDAPSSSGDGSPKAAEAGAEITATSVFPSRIVRSRRAVGATLWGGRTLGVSVG
ncbi:helix-turn-helix domain-containing protein [Sinorhizobium glycinis]|uniref:helix-turn-helix domain-containing protein n=1 Tax=Sinorhizobium glycinis TaxID=1472378 RepID=UPI001FCD9D9C|nr:helix-turn-helix transcriptional regulator [Sinorhizobium glycinis]